MSPGIEAAACAPEESAAGISDTQWIRVKPDGSGVSASTVLVIGGEGRQSTRPQNLQLEWQATARSQLESILRLEAGWDSYGALSVSPVAVQRALRILASATLHARPSVVPTSKGGVQLEWHGGDIDIEVECLRTGVSRLIAEDGQTGQSEERWVVPGHPAIDEWLRRLST